MHDYSDPDSPLTASRYAWDVTFKLGPATRGSITTQRIEGTYTTQPGATVGSLCEGLITWYAQNIGASADDVSIMRYSLREK